MSTESTASPRLRIVVTGGPGAGKTTVLEALARQGCIVVPEVARAIIRERLAAGLPPRPDPSAFARLVFERERDNYLQATGDLVFFDRGILDGIGGLQASGLITADERQQLVQQYPVSAVFLFTAWREIYHTDSERDQDFAHAARVSEAMRRFVERAGYQPVIVPEIGVAERAAFILDTCAMLR